MYRKCPECGYERTDQDTASDDTCPRCGLVFSKWAKRRFATPAPQPVEEEQTDGVRHYRQLLVDRVLAVPEDRDGMRFYGYGLVYLLLLAWGIQFIWMDMETNAIGGSFMHNVNLVFHEAGHVLFRPFGWFMTILGGSLMQLIVPVVVLGVFLFKEGNAFGASVGLWWLGQSLMDLAPYVNDARALELMLLGGGTGLDRPGMHDWENILGYLGLLEQDHTIAWMVDVSGELLMLASFLWGAYLLKEMYRKRQ